MNIHKALLSGYIAIDRIASRTRFTGEEVIQLLDPDGEDGGMEDTFFPGSDEELCVTEDESEDDDEPQRSVYRVYNT